MAAFDIRTHIIDQSEADLLYEQNPRLKESWEKFCPTCNLNKHYKWRGSTVDCDCQMQLQLYKHYLLAGIGLRYQRLNWDDFQGDPEALRLVRKYLDTPNLVERGIGLILHGEIGTGKTMLSHLILKELVKRGHQCYSTTFAEMINLFTAGWYSDQERRKFERRVEYSDVLLLDDVGKEFRAKNNLNEATFDTVLRARHDSARPTIVTTNMSLKEMKQGYGSAIFSLLSGTSIDYAFTGEDFRVKTGCIEADEVFSGEVRPIF